MRISTRILTPAIIAAFLAAAGPMYAYDGQVVTSSTTSTETSCRDEPTIVTQPTGGSTCEVGTENESPSADFAGASHCQPELAEVTVMMPVCTSKIYTTTTKRRKTCHSSSTSSGCNVSWTVISETTTCKTSKGDAC